MKNTHSLLWAALLVALATRAAAATITLETPALGPATHDEDWRPDGGFTSGGALFSNTYESTFGTWAGFALSRETDATTPGFGNQFSAFAGSGAGGSLQYGVGFVDGFTPFLPTITLPSGEAALSLAITNTTYAALSMRDGDAFAKKFGGASGNDPDFLLLTITGRDASLVPTGQVDFYLADYRFADNAQDYIVDAWATVDVSSFGAGTATIEFTLSSSDNGAFGMNTPAYFAVDNVQTVPEPVTAGFVLLGLLGLGARRHRIGPALGRAVVIGGLSLFGADSLQAGPYAPAAGQPGSSAIPAADPGFTQWANSVVDFQRGPQTLTDPSVLANFGAATAALGAPDNSFVSLGDGGWLTLGFEDAIFDGPGADFAIFENGFAAGGLAYLELGFVEVSSNGSDFFRFPAVSLTQTATQVGSFGLLDATNLDNLAGKYVAGFGTPFDLAALDGISPLLDVDAVQFVRVVDVVGSIDPLYRTTDSLGNVVNDPWPTAFGSSGFDYEAVGVIHSVPEPAVGALLVLGFVVTAGRRPRRGSTITTA